MPWRGVIVSEQRQRILEDNELNYYSFTDLAERFGISRTTSNNHPGHQGKGINWFKQHGQAGFHEGSRRVCTASCGKRMGRSWRSSCGIAHGPPSMGSMKTAGPDASTRSAAEASGGSNGRSDPGQTRTGTVPQTARAGRRRHRRALPRLSLEL